MAKVVGPLHSSEARGAVGSLTYNTWRGISTVKTRSGPTTTQSTLQVAIRALTALATASWQSLTDAQRSLWEEYSRSNLDLDWTGNPQRLSGYNWYVRINVRRQLLGNSIGTTPPTVSLDYYVLDLDFHRDTGTTLITWTSHSADASLYIDFFGVGPHSAGRNPGLRMAHKIYGAVSPESYELAQWDGDPYGTLTLFARGILYTGVTAGWAKIKKTVSA